MDQRDNTYCNIYINTTADENIRHQVKNLRVNLNNWLCYTVQS